MSVSTSVEINSAIAQIMELEKDKLNQLQSQKNGISTKNSAWAEIDKSFESLQSKLKTLSSQSTFTSKITATTNANVATATAGTNAVQAVYQMKVSRLAQNAKVTSANSIGLLDGRYAVLKSSEQINASGSVTVDPNVKFSSGKTAMRVDSDKAVVSGSFKINGRTVLVTGEDTIFTVLSKINSSNAGVTATFDSTADKISFTTSKYGTGQAVNLTEDTSGFLDAMKLTNTNGNPAVDFTDGAQSDLYNKLNTTSLVSGTAKITNGYFTINNITFSVDTTKDSLSSVLNKINNSKAGVTAFYDDISGKVTVSSKETGKSISFENDTSGFLKNIGVMNASGDQDASATKSVYKGTTSQVTINGEVFTRDGNSFALGGTTFNLVSSGTSNITVAQDNQKAVSAVKSFVDQYNSTISLIDRYAKDTLKGERVLNELKLNLQKRMSQTFSNSGQFSKVSDAGISFVRTIGEGLGKLKFTQSTLTSSLNTSSLDVSKIFSDDLDEDGTADAGYGLITNAFLTDYTKNSKGVFSNRISSSGKVTSNLDKRIASEEKRLEKREADLKKQFEKLNAAVSSMDSQIQSLQSFTARMQAITNSYNR